jgi:hypothetical protein
MAEPSKTLAYGILDENGDTWFVRRPNEFILLDVPFAFDLSLQHKSVSVVGTMGVPPSALGITKLIAERLVGHEDIAKRAYEIHSSSRAGSADDDWFRAERELLGLGIARAG